MSSPVEKKNEGELKILREKQTMGKHIKIVWYMDIFVVTLIWLTIK